MAVAVNVLTLAADCGLGIFAAAKALDLDFVPLALERYDLVLPRRTWTTRASRPCGRSSAARTSSAGCANWAATTPRLRPAMRPGMGLGA